MHGISCHRRRHNVTEGASHTCAEGPHRHNRGLLPPGECTALPEDGVDLIGVGHGDVIQDEVGHDAEARRNHRPRVTRAGLLDDRDQDWGCEEKAPGSGYKPTAITRHLTNFKH